MKRPRRQPKSALLIRCEGSVTEPNYFKILRKQSIERGIWDTVEIIPEPPGEDDEETTASPHKSNRKKRTIENIVLPAEADADEQKCNWWQTPTKFVKEARDGLKNDGFDEVWAVFDKNGHPAHQFAFQLAQKSIRGKVVNIAFSSVAFEHWILLHFEKNDSAFLKAACKNSSANRGSRDEYITCGTGLHEQDCNGKNCVLGHLRVKNYFSSEKNDSAFISELQRLATSEEMRKKVYENAAWLRYKVSFNKSAPYLSNPYTDVDFLVKRLLGEDELTFDWCKPGESKDWHSLRLLVTNTTGQLVVQISNTGQTTRLLNGKDISIFLDNQMIPDIPANFLIPPGESAKWIIPHTQFEKLEIKDKGHYLLVALKD